MRVLSLGINSVNSLKLSSMTTIIIKKRIIYTELLSFNISSYSENNSLVFKNGSNIVVEISKNTKPQARLNLNRERVLRHFHVSTYGHLMDIFLNIKASVSQETEKSMFFFFLLP